MVASMFKYLEVPFIPPLKGGGLVRRGRERERGREETKCYKYYQNQSIRKNYKNYRYYKVKYFKYYIKVLGFKYIVYII